MPFSTTWGILTPRKGKFHPTNITTHGELVATLTGTFSVLALIPAAIGLYGVMSYNMLRMTIEMLF